MSLWKTFVALLRKEKVEPEIKVEEPVVEVKKKVSKPRKKTPKKKGKG